MPFCTLPYNRHERKPQRAAAARQTCRPVIGQQGKRVINGTNFRVEITVVRN
jgi:hypothetical protein